MTDSGGPTRRQALTWLTTGLGSLALGGCPRRPLSRFHSFHVRLRRREYRVQLDRHLHSGPLQLNETLTLRRYRGHSSPLAREAQLIHLAQTAEAEEAFFHTRPDNVWTEIGLFAEQGENTWQSYGIRNLPFGVLVRLFTGKVAGIQAARRIVNYHNHPIRFVRRTLRRLGQPKRYQRLALLPSAGDFFVHAQLFYTFYRRGIPLQSKVAVPDAIIGYDVSPRLRQRILTHRRPQQLQEMQIYEAARLAFAKNDINRKFFQQILRSRLQEAGHQGDEFRLQIRAAPAVEDTE